MNSFTRVRAFQIELEFGSVGFWGEGKTGVPGEKSLRAKKRTNNKLNPHMVSTPGVEPGTHWWEASALTTAQSLAPLLATLGTVRGAREVQKILVQGTIVENKLWEHSFLVPDLVSSLPRVFVFFFRRRAKRRATGSPVMTRRPRSHVRKLKAGY